MKFYFKTVPKSNSNELIMFFHQLLQNTKTKRIIVILDNASIHTSKKVVNFLKRNPKIELKYLPTYSPEYNPVEQIWLFLKRNILSKYIEGGIHAVLKEWRRFIWRWQEHRLITSFKVGLGIWEEIL